MAEYNQPYNLVLIGSFGVGKSCLFQKLSCEVHADYHYSTLQDTGAVPEGSRQLLFDKWTHSALVNGEEVKVCHS